MGAGPLTTQQEGVAVLEESAEVGVPDIIKQV